MFISDALNQITHISEKEEINSRNYLEALAYISNLHEFILQLKGAISLTKIKFLPSFKGKFAVEELGIASSAEENEMKVFRVSSKLFLEDKQRKAVTEALRDMMKELFFTEDVLFCTLR